MSRRRPPLESLRIFEACARQLNFSRAATELGITQSAVSLRIRDLEADLGLPLFRRTKPRLALTYAGRELAAEMTGILALLDKALDRLRPAGPDGGMLRVTAAPTFAARWLAPRLARYEARHPAATLQIDSGVALETLGPGGYDLAIRSGRGDWPGLESRLLFRLARAPMLAPKLLERLAANPAGGPRPADLLRVPLLADEGWPDWFAAAGLPVAAAGALTVTRARYPTQDLLAEAALAGAGAALLSPVFFAPLLAEGRLVQPFATRLIGPEGYYTVHDPATPSAARDSFLAWLAAELRAGTPTA